MRHSDVAVVQRKRHAHAGLCAQPRSREGKAGRQQVERYRAARRRRRLRGARRGRRWWRWWRWRWRRWICRGRRWRRKRSRRRSGRGRHLCGRWCLGDMGAGCGRRLHGGGIGIVAAGQRGREGASGQQGKNGEPEPAAIGHASIMTHMPSLAQDAATLASSACRAPGAFS
jgi:hypothetical protein